MPPDVLAASGLSATNAGGATEGRMQRFVAALLTAKGALVEPVEPEGLEVLSPGPVQSVLDLAEVDRLGFGPVQPTGARRVGLEGDWLERFGRLLGEQGRSARRVLAPELRSLGSPERLLEHQLVLDNATYRLLGVEPAWTRYLLLDFRFSATSDEKRDGVLQLGINLATGALPDAVLARVLPELDAQADDPAVPDGAVPDGAVPGGAVPGWAALPESWDMGRVLQLTSRALQPRLDAALAPFAKGLRRRFERDRDRLYGYHNDLYCEAVRRIGNMAEADPARRRDEARAEAAGREYRAKLEDLSRQYAMRVDVEWVQTLELVMPVQRLAVQIRRRKAERSVFLDWNPVARLLEAPACEATSSMERPRLVCDDALHLVSPDGLAPCPGCGKPFCRACHRDACPKCGEAVPRPALRFAGD